MTACQVCGTEFETRGRGQKYCSAKCKQAAYRERLRQGRAVPLDTVAELESLRRSRDYYRRKSENLKFELDMALLDAQRMRPLNWATNQPVVQHLTGEEENELQRLKRRVRAREREEWRRPLLGLLRPGRSGLPWDGRLGAEMTSELYGDVVTLWVKLSAATTGRVWEELGYSSAEEWWSSILDAAGQILLDSIAEGSDGYVAPEWLVQAEAAEAAALGEPGEVASSEAS